MGTHAVAGWFALLPVGCQKDEPETSGETQIEETSSSPSSEQTSTSKAGASVDTAYDTAPLFTAQPPALSATIADEPSEPDVSNAPLQTCVPTSGPGQNLVIDDFEDEDLDLPQEEGRLGQWYTYEEVSGDHALSNGELETPRLGSHWAAHTSGSDHGSWAGFGVQLSDCVYDGTKFVGLHFWIRGSSNPIDVAILTPGIVPFANGGTCTEEEEGGCWDAYRVQVEVGAEWREYFLPFNEFEQGGYGQDAGPLDVTRLRSIEFQSDAGVFEYWVDDVGFYIEEVYTPIDDTSGEVGSTNETTTIDLSTNDADAGLESSEDPTTTDITTSLVEETTLPVDGGAQ